MGIQKRRLTLIDWKSGEDHGYKRQLAHYALALMDQEKETECDICEVYLKQLAISKHMGVKRYTLTYKEASELVYGIYERVLNKSEETYHINDYCGWCKLKGHGCPEWEKVIAPAVQAVEAPPENRGRLDEILEDAEARGKFIVAFRALKSLYEKMGFEERAKEEPGSYLMTYERKGRSTIDAELFLNEVAKKMGTMRASTCITVSVEKAQEAWAKFSKDPFPVPVVEGPKIKVLKEDRKQLNEPNNAET